MIEDFYQTAHFVYVSFFYKAGRRKLYDERKLSASGYEIGAAPILRGGVTWNRITRL
jgi:hypothetical protein